MRSNALVQLDDPLDECRVVEAGLEVPPRIWIPVAIQDRSNIIFCGSQIVLGVPELFCDPHLLRLGKDIISHTFRHDEKP